jgi:tetratricopeptide (TPR) repeat protein
VRWLPVAALLLLVAGRARADEGEEAARARFEHGSQLYGEGRYAEAMTEFEAAARIRPRPAFHFNIARCHERLGHFAEAAREYRLYLAEDPNNGEALELKSHITVLEARAAPVAQEQPPPSSAPRRRVWPWLVGAGLVVAAVAVVLAVALVPADAAIPSSSLGAMGVRF